MVVCTAAYQGTGKVAAVLQVVVICGRNDALRRKLSSGAFNKGATQVHAFGFVKNMHEFMNASDAIITKAGTPYTCP